MTKKTTLIFFLLTILALLTWFNLTYPQLAFINLSINRKQAEHIAENYLKARLINTAAYRKASAFNSMDEFNKYMQRTVGFDCLKQFVKNHYLYIFYLTIRFFKENQKEGEESLLSDGEDDERGDDNSLSAADENNHKAVQSYIEDNLKNLAVEDNEMAMDSLEVLQLEFSNPDIVSVSYSDGENKRKISFIYESKSSAQFFLICIS